jgi:hypothetical protein
LANVIVSNNSAGRGDAAEVEILEIDDRYRERSFDFGAADVRAGDNEGIEVDGFASFLRAGRRGGGSRLAGADADTARKRPSMAGRGRRAQRSVGLVLMGTAG